MKRKQTRNKVKVTAQKIRDIEEPKWDGEPDRVTLINAYSWYHENYDHEGAMAFLETHLKHNERFDELEAVKRINVRHFSPVVGFIARIKDRGLDVPGETHKFFNKRLKQYVESVDMGDSPAVRKRARRKTNGVDKEQESLVSYLPYSEEYEIESIDPHSLDGRKCLVVFNTKTRMIGYFQSATGMKLHRTTLKQVDEAYCKTLRKPEEQLSEVQGMKFRDFKKWFDGLKAKPKNLSTRLNKYQLLMGVS